MNLTKSLQCPFTWDIEETLISQYDENDELETSINAQPVLSLMKSITFTYANAIQQKYECAKVNLWKTDIIWDEITKSKMRELKDDKISPEVLLHIKEATKFFILKNNSIEESTKILNNITDSSQFKSKAEISTIEGCKGIILLNCHEKALKKAIDHAKLAYTNNPDCALWNFIMAKCLRGIRRMDNFSNNVTSQERTHFLQSYKLLKNHLYGINLVDMYIHIREIDKAKKLCDKIFEEKPSDIGIVLKLTKCFISFQKFQKAQECLDFIESLAPHNSTFLLYKAMYFEKQGDLEEAIKYCKQANEGKRNFTADMIYVRCMIKSKKEFNYVDYIKHMLNKYDNYSYKQKLLLDLGMHYYFMEHNALEASLHFINSYKLNPKTEIFQNYFSFLKKGWINVFDFIKLQLIPKLQKYCFRDPLYYESIIKNLKDTFSETEVSN